MDAAVGTPQEAHDVAARSADGDEPQAKTRPPRAVRIVSRVRLSLTVIVTVLVVLGEFMLLHAVYHIGDSSRDARVIAGVLEGRLESAGPAVADQLPGSAGRAVAQFDRLKVGGPEVASLRRFSTIKRPDPAQVSAARAASMRLSDQLATDVSHANRKADLIYIVLLIGVSLGWMVWFRRLVGRHRRLQQEVTAAQVESQNEQRLAALVRNATDLVLLSDVDGNITFATPSAFAVLGTQPEDLVSRNCLEFVHPADRGAFSMALSTLHSDEDRDVNIRMRHSDGRVLDIEGTVTDLSHDPVVNALLITVRDVTTRVELQEQLRHQAFYDSLTSLANRQLFSDRLAHAMARNERDGSKTVAVLFCDLDEFKNINDSLGHRVGDAVLAEVGQRAQSVTRTADTVARLGGDEFAILLEDTSLAEATVVARKFLQALETPVVADGHTLLVRASVGIAMGGAEARSGDEVLRNADVAMYLAKERGKGTIAAYDGELHSLQLDRLLLRDELEAAVARDELSVHYQPIVDLSTRRISGFEALVRWQHPVRGLVGPVDFIPLAERSGLIHALGRFVLRAACRAAVDFTRIGGRRITVSVNVAARQFSRATFVPDVETALRDAGLPPDQLTIEITETVLLADLTETVERLAELRRLGVRIAIDDFGTGYSSLAYLRDLPLDILKVDKAFIDGAADGGNDSALTESILAMSRSLNLATVAEGVESEDQLSWLTESLCGYGQGYLWSRPVPQAEAAGLLTQLDSAGRPELAVDDLTASDLTAGGLMAGNSVAQRLTVDAIRADAIRADAIRADAARTTPAGRQPGGPDVMTT